MKPSFQSLPAFAQGYIMAAFWTNDDLAGSGEYSTSGRPEAMYDKLSIEALEFMLADCLIFQKDNAEVIKSSGIEDGMAGHCFWLSRNRHGSGFFDEETISHDLSFDYQDALQQASKAFRECDLYAGDDGQLYI